VQSITSFALYGFPESHSSSFALLAYASAWLKVRQPAPFYAALLNNQPMGFYHPSVLVEDLKRHGLKALPVEINRSGVRCLPERIDGDDYAMRIGFNYVRDLGEDGRDAIVDQRKQRGPYRSFDDFLDRLRGGPIGPRAVRNLVMVGAFDHLGQPRRDLLWGWQERWHGTGLRKGIDKQSELRMAAVAPTLPYLDDFDANQLEYRISDLSTGHHLIHFCRERLDQLRALRSNQVPSIPSGRNVRVAGLVITRQAPATANRIRFFTLEDEFGHVNITIKPDVYERYRNVANRQPILIIDGVMQRQDGVWSVLATHIEALSGVPRPQTRSHDYR
jgi:error-prone DNA polymerase